MYCPGGPLVVLCVPTLVETPMVPVGVADEELLSGLTSSQSWAANRSGAQRSSGATGPMNCATTCASSTRFGGDLQNFTLLPVKRGLVQLSTPSLKVKVVLMEPTVSAMEKGCFTTLKSVET